jgi:hypothetical protein
LGSVHNLVLTALREDHEITSGQRDQIAPILEPKPATPSIDHMKGRPIDSWDEYAPGGREFEATQHLSRQTHGVEYAG